MAGQGHDQPRRDQQEAVAEGEEQTVNREAEGEAHRLDLVGEEYDALREGLGKSRDQDDAERQIPDVGQVQRVRKGIRVQFEDAAERMREFGYERLHRACLLARAVVSLSLREEGE